MIISEINRRFLQEAGSKYNDFSKAEQMSIFGYDKINMANLCIIGSHTVNGVAKLHSEILRRTVFKKFYEYSPYKFTNVTNGITHRRWLNQSNPKLKNLLDDLIGADYTKHPSKLSELKKYIDDDVVLHKLDEIKYENKKLLAEFIYNTYQISVNTDSIFDIQAKRLHEYKRQLLNALRIISLIIDINEGNTTHIKPETFIFAAKAAPGYYRAKEIIQMWSLLKIIQYPWLK